MTKATMINYIETTNMIINFNRNYLMSKSKAEIERLYNMAIEVAERKNQEREVNIMKKFKVELLYERGFTASIEDTMEKAIDFYERMMATGLYAKGCIKVIEG